MWCKGGKKRKWMISLEVHVVVSRVHRCLYKTSAHHMTRTHGKPAWRQCKFLVILPLLPRAIEVMLKRGEGWHFVDASESS
mmetsp:Transcript_6518/g.9276  ORF Transcript_6518/g.9276 Transcript_6518/m.9276 type:complete len:81 (+) Transcript_6518:163-405(+)